MRIPSNAALFTIWPLIEFCNLVWESNFIISTGEKIVNEQ